MGKVAKDMDSPEKEKALLEWQAPEFVVYSRSLKWYLAAFASLFLVFGYSVFTGDWFIAVLVIILGLALFFNTRRQAKEVKYKITQLGLYVDDTLYPFTEIHSFWLNVIADQRILNVVFIKKYLPALPVIFYGVDPVVLKSTLSKYIPEQENHDENLADKLTRILKI